MEKTMKFLSMAALALMGAVMTGCSSDSDELFSEPQQPENKDKVETLTTTVSFGDGVAATRALTEDGVKTFAVGDQIAVAYKNSQDEWVKAVSTALTADDITNGGKSAKFTVTVTNANKNIDVKYIYPASLATDDGYVDYEPLDVQDGTFATIASSLDACQGFGAWNGENLPGITLDNLFTLCKFTIKAGGKDITKDITQLTISNGDTYIVNPTSSLDAIWVAIRPVGKGDITIYAAKGKELYKKTVSGKTLDMGKIYPINVTTTKVDGAVSGQFTVNSSGKKVYFSQGNLQATYNSESWSWAFAEHQYSFIDNTSGNTTISTSVKETSEPYAMLSTTNGTVDLFGWSTAATYYGIASSYNDNDIYSGEFVDWGNLTISISAPNTWRTLSGGDEGEWKYLLDIRKGSTIGGTDNARYLKAMVNSDATAVKGLIIFPDIFIWNTTTMGTAPTTCNTADDNFNHSLTTAQWNALEAAGAVFLPVAGSRAGTYVTDRQNDNYFYGYYWANNPFNAQSAHCLSFSKTTVNAATYYVRSYGRSVRLVRDL
jgi:hypothetical protein